MTPEAISLLKERIDKELHNSFKTLEETIVTYKDALDLNRIGFNESCSTYFGEVNEGEFWAFQRDAHEKEFMTGVLAPTYQQAFSFIERVYAVKGYTIHTNSNGTWNFAIHQWNFDNNIGQWEYINNISSQETQRLSEMACFKKLIELVDIRIELIKKMKPL